MTVDSLIRDAFLQYADGKPWPVGKTGVRQPPISTRLLEQEIKGSPAWLDSDHYTIEAKADATVTRETMRGPMLQALLADRFRLKIHRETRTVPVYELRVAQGGPRLEVAIDGGCTVVDRDHPPPFPVPGKPFHPKLCGGWSVDSVYGTTMANLCRQISPFSDRDVVDRTGITGLFDLHFAFLRPDLFQGEAFEGRSETPEAMEAARARDATFFTAIQNSLPKLGLKLVPAKGSDEFLIIDHVEKPSQN